MQVGHYCHIHTYTVPEEFMSFHKQTTVSEIGSIIFIENF